MVPWTSRRVFALATLFVLAAALLAPWGQVSVKLTGTADGDETFEGNVFSWGLWEENGDDGNQYFWAMHGVYGLDKAPGTGHLRVGFYMMVVALGLAVPALVAEARGRPLDPLLLAFLALAGLAAGAVSLGYFVQGLAWFLPGYEMYGSCSNCTQAEGDWGVGPFLLGTAVVALGGWAAHGWRQARQIARSAGLGA
ncbi:MAG: hypothetical protein AABY18_03915 [Candidatus Thermoplasmatota archaeon]